MAGRIGVTPQAISLWEHGERQPTHPASFTLMLLAAERGFLVDIPGKPKSKSGLSLSRDEDASKRTAEDLLIIMAESDDPKMRTRCFEELMTRRPFKK